MSNDYISDQEILYRCVFYGRNCYQIIEKSAKVSSQAFADRHQQPSVDRAILCNNNPHHTQKELKDGVVSLLTNDIRLIDSVVQNDQKGNPQFTYKIDVVYRPSDDNIAHAQIEPNPEYRNKTPFRKLLERLAYLANQRQWEIEPYEIRIE